LYLTFPGFGGLGEAQFKVS